MLFSRMPTALSIATTLLAGLCVSGCNQGNVGVDGATQESAGERTSLDPEQMQTFSQEAISLKTKYPDLRDYDVEIRGLFARYGLKAPASVSEAFSPLVPDLAPDPDFSTEGTAAAAKTAALATVWKKVKAFDITYPHALVAGFDLPNGEVMTAWTNQIDATLDPYLVAFYAPSGRWDMDAINIIALDDDGLGYPNASITWRNNTGATQHVFMIAFGYSASTSGRGKLKFRTTSAGPISTRTGKINAYRTYANNNVLTAGCSGPFASRLELKRLEGGFYGTGIIGVNPSTMKGANIWDFNTVANFSEVLTPTGGNFVMPYLQHLDGDTYPNGNHYSGWQEDKYTCTVF